MRRIRVVRVIEYIGPENWINATLAGVAVTPAGSRFALASDRQITEIACTKRVVSDTTAAELNEDYNRSLGSLERYK